MHLTRRTALTGLAVGSALIRPALAQAAPLQETPEQILGPFYPLRRGADSDADLTMVDGRSARALGDAIEVSGRVLTVKGEPVEGAMLELWQANAAGRYAHGSDPNTTAPLDPNFQGYAKLRTDRTGAFRFVTVKPGAYPIGGGRSRTPHIHFDISGQTDRLATQMYFPNEALNETDIVRKDLGRMAGLATARDDGKTADGRRRLVWDIVLTNG